MVQGHNSELLELSPEKLLVLRVAEQQAARAQTLEEVREQVVEAVRAEQAAAAARAAGEQALQALASGQSLQQLASDGGWQLHQAVTVGRDSDALPVALRELAFEMPRPAGEAELASTVLANGDYALLVLSDVKDGDPGELQDATRQLLGARMATLSGRMEFMSVARALRDQADVRVMLQSKDNTAE
jgi:peptidyl-prolyl cis-trans isomerase D